MPESRSINNIGDRPPKILHVSTVSITLSQFIAPIAERLRDLGCQVDAAAAGIGDNQRCAVAFDQCHEIPFQRKFLAKANLTVAAKRLAELVQRESYDLVHVHTPIASFVTRRTLRNRPDHQKVVYTAHGFHFFDGAGWLRNKLFSTLEKSAARWMDHLIVINRQDYKNALRLGLADENSMTYMPGIGIDLAKFRLPENTDQIRKQKLNELGIPEDSFVFLKVAGFTKNKKHCDAVRAFAKLLEKPNKERRFDLLLAGDGATQDETRALVMELGLNDRVHFLGFRRDIKQLLVACDVMMLVSGREGLPCSVMEAMALQKTVVGTNIRGTSDLLADGAGLLVPPDNPDRLAQAMIESQNFETNDSQRLEILRQCSLNEIVSQHIALYQDLLNWTAGEIPPQRPTTVTNEVQKIV